MPLMTDYYPEARFGGFTDVDGTLAFYQRIRAMVTSQSVVVDFGCGRGAHQDDPVALRKETRILRGRVKTVIGLDVDPQAAANPYIDQFLHLEGPAWPLGDSSADLVICDNVLEHLPEPGVFFAEANRVLKPGGALCIRTPNRLGYVAVLSKLIHNRRHASLLEKVKADSQAQDVFPAYYHCNTIPAIRRALKANGFEGIVYGYEAEPSYLDFSRLAYALGVLHQRFAPGWLKLALFCFATKKPN